MHDRRSLKPAVALGLAMFLPAFGTHGLNAGRGDLARALAVAADGGAMALVMAAFALAAVVAYAVVGRVGDSRGLRRTLHAGALAFTAAHALLLVQEPLTRALGWAPWGLFLALRVVAGAAGGAITVSANALGTLLYRPEERGRAMSLVWLGVPLALVVGVPLPLLLGKAWEALPPSVAPWCGEPYVAVAFVAGVAALLFVVRAVPEPDAPSAAAADAASPLPSLASTWWIYATSLLMPLGVFPLIVSADAYAHDVLAFDRTARAGLLILLGVASVAGGIVSSMVADRLGRRRTLLLALALFALLTLLLPPAPAWGYVAVAALLGFVSTVRQGPFQALASFVADARGRGRFSARVLISSQFGISVGQFSGVALAGAGRPGATMTLWPLASLSIGCTVAALLLALRLREPAVARSDA